MDGKTIAKELAEEIRTNGALRHRLGMGEGSESGVVEFTEDDAVFLDTRGWAVLRRGGSFLEAVGCAGLG